MTSDTQAEVFLLGRLSAKLKTPPPFQTQSSYVVMTIDIAEVIKLAAG